MSVESDTTTSQTPSLVPPPPATLAFALKLGPLSSVLGDVAGLLGESLLSLLGMFYPTLIAKRANVVVTELVTNVVENIVEPTSDFELRVQIDPSKLQIEVTNSVRPEQYEKVKARIEQVATPEAARKLLTQTIRERRPQRLKGGLGLMRLVAENRFNLSVRHDGDRMTVRAEHVLRSEP